MINGVILATMAFIAFFGSIFYIVKRIDIETSKKDK